MSKLERGSHERIKDTCHSLGDHISLLFSFLVAHYDDVETRLRNNIFQQIFQFKSDVSIFNFRYESD